MTCIIDHRDDWYGGIGDPPFKERQIWIGDIKGQTLRQVICKAFNTTSNDIKNSPGLYGICGVPILDFNQIVDETLIRTHITKRFKKSKSDSFFCPNNLTIEEYTFCSDYRLIVEFNPNHD